MSFKFQIYPDPLDARVSLAHDNGFVGIGVPNTDPVSGRKGQLITIPDGTPDENGASLMLEREGYVTMSVRGFLILRTDGVARLQVDDYRLVLVPVVVDPPVPPDPPTTGPDPNANPLDIIIHVFNSTNPNLSTAAGCGLFTEDCCKELHEKMHPAWGHMKKNPGQNQFNGHAVDAITLLVPSGHTAPGTYDIIYSSASPQAAPVFNYAGPADPLLWYYPPAPIDMGMDLRSVTTWHSGKR